MLDRLPYCVPIVSVWNGCAWLEYCPVIVPLKGPQPPVDDQATVTVESLLVIADKLAFASVRQAVPAVGVDAMVRGCTTVGVLVGV